MLENRLCAVLQAPHKLWQRRNRLCSPEAAYTASLWRLWWERACNSQLEGSKSALVTRRKTCAQSWGPQAAQSASLLTLWQGIDSRAEPVWAIRPQTTITTM